jgi:hypothetical protein
MGLKVTATPLLRCLVRRRVRAGNNLIYGTVHTKNYRTKKTKTRNPFKVRTVPKIFSNPSFSSCLPSFLLRKSLVDGLGGYGGAV